MPRQLRVEYPEAIYHVMSRGDRQKDIYVDDVDRQDFLKSLAEACHKTGFEISAKTHRAKLAMVGRLRRETTLTIRAIAERLHMGSWKSVNNRLYLTGKRDAKESKRAKK